MTSTVFLSAAGLSALAGLVMLFAVLVLGWLFLRFSRRVLAWGMVGDVGQAVAGSMLLAQCYLPSTSVVGSVWRMHLSASMTTGDPTTFRVVGRS